MRWLDGITDSVDMSLLKLMSIELVMPFSHLILCRPFLLLPPIPPSIRVFSNESTLHMRWPKYWSFSFSSSPSNEYPGLNSFRMDIVIKPPLLGNRASLVAETVKNSPVVWETWVRSLGWKDPLEEGMATHCNILFWRIPMDRGPWWATVHGVAESEMTE